MPKRVCSASIDAVKRIVVLVLQRHVPGRLTHSFFSGAALPSTTSQSSCLFARGGVGRHSLVITAIAFGCAQSLMLLLMQLLLLLLLRSLLWVVECKLNANEGWRMTPLDTPG
jgi:hypothetical protein